MIKFFLYLALVLIMFGCSAEDLTPINDILSTELIDGIVATGENQELTDPNDFFYSPPSVRSTGTDTLYIPLPLNHYSQSFHFPKQVTNKNFKDSDYEYQIINDRNRKATNTVGGELAIDNDGSISFTSTGDLIDRLTNQENLVFTSKHIISYKNKAAGVEKKKPLNIVTYPDLSAIEYASFQFKRPPERKIYLNSYLNGKSFPLKTDLSEFFSFSLEKETNQSSQSSQAISIHSGTGMITVGKMTGADLGGTYQVSVSNRITEKIHTNRFVFRLAPPSSDISNRRSPGISDIDSPTPIVDPPDASDLEYKDLELNFNMRHYFIAPPKKLFLPSPLFLEYPQYKKKYLSDPVHKEMPFWNQKRSLLDLSDFFSFSLENENNPGSQSQLVTIHPRTGIITVKKDAELEGLIGLGGGTYITYKVLISDRLTQKIHPKRFSLRLHYPDASSIIEYDDVYQLDFTDSRNKRLGKDIKPLFSNPPPLEFFFPMTIHSLFNKYTINNPYKHRYIYKRKPILLEKDLSRFLSFSLKKNNQTNQSQAVRINSKTGIITVNQNAELLDTVDTYTVSILDRLTQKVHTKRLSLIPANYSDDYPNISDLEYDDVYQLDFTDLRNKRLEKDIKPLFRNYQKSPISPGIDLSRFFHFSLKKEKPNQASQSQAVRINPGTGIITVSQDAGIDSEGTYQVSISNHLTKRVHTKTFSLHLNYLDASSIIEYDDVYQLDFTDLRNKRLGKDIKPLFRNYQKSPISPGIDLSRFFHFSLKKEKPNQASQSQAVRINPGTGIITVSQDAGIDSEGTYQVSISNHLTKRVHTKTFSLIPTNYPNEYPDASALEYPDISFNLGQKMSYSAGPIDPKILRKMEEPILKPFYRGKYPMYMANGDLVSYDENGLILMGMYRLGSHLLDLSKFFSFSLEKEGDSQSKLATINQYGFVIVDLNAELSNLGGGGTYKVSILDRLTQEVHTKRFSLHFNYPDVSDIKYNDVYQLNNFTAPKIHKIGGEDIDLKPLRLGRDKHLNPLFKNSPIPPETDLSRFLSFSVEKEKTNQISHQAVSVNRKTGSTTKQKAVARIDQSQALIIDIDEEEEKIVDVVPTSQSQLVRINPKTGVITIDQDAGIIDSGGYYKVSILDRITQTVHTKRFLLRTVTPDDLEYPRLKFNLALNDPDDRRQRADIRIRPWLKTKALTTDFFKSFSAIETDWSKFFSFISVEKEEENPTHQPQLVRINPKTGVITIKGNAGIDSGGYYRISILDHITQTVHTKRLYFRATPSKTYTERVRIDINEYLDLDAILKISIIHKYDKNQDREIPLIHLGLHGDFKTTPTPEKQILDYPTLAKDYYRRIEKKLTPHEWYQEVPYFHKLRDKRNRSLGENSKYFMATKFYTGRTYRLNHRLRRDPILNRTSEFGWDRTSALSWDRTSGFSWDMGPPVMYQPKEDLEKVLAGEFPHRQMFRVKNIFNHIRADLFFDKKLQLKSHFPLASDFGSQRVKTSTASKTETRGKTSGYYVGGGISMGPNIGPKGPSASISLNFSAYYMNMTSKTSSETVSEANSISEALYGIKHYRQNGQYNGNEFQQRTWKWMASKSLRAVDFISSELDDDDKDYLYETDEDFFNVNPILGQAQSFGFSTEFELDDLSVLGSDDEWVFFDLELDYAYLRDAVHAIYNNYLVEYDERAHPECSNYEELERKSYRIAKKINLNTYEMTDYQWEDPSLPSHRRITGGKKVIKQETFDWEEKANDPKNELYKRIGEYRYLWVPRKELTYTECKLKKGQHDPIIPGSLRGKDDYIDRMLFYFLYFMAKPPEYFYQYQSMVEEFYDKIWWNKPLR